MHMKKTMIWMMLTTFVAAMTGCSADDPFEEFSSENSWNYGGNMPGGSSGSSGTTGELATFDVAINTAATEPSERTEAYFPDEEDALENNEFTTEVTIDLSNPMAKTENGVEVTVNGGR